MTALVSAVWAREILDSRGRPTVEADVALSDGSCGRASVPSGRSTGTHEATELRDGEPERYRGGGVRRAVENVRQVLGPSIRGMSGADQRSIDDRLREIDGTPTKSHLGANAILAVSLASARAAAAGRGIPLFRHIADLAEVEQPRIPSPMFNIVSGGLHAGDQLDIQDVLVIPTRAPTFAGALEAAVAIHAAVGDRVRAEGHPPLVADEGGWAPRLSLNEDALAWVRDGVRAAGAEARLAVDVAATHFWTKGEGTYRLKAEGRTLPGAEMIGLLVGWVGRFDLALVEDGLGEDDWDGWKRLTRVLGARVEVVGDDLFTTNPERLRRGIEERAANAILIKPNQIGTLSETLDVFRMATAAGLRTIVSARSGETEDPFLADLAVGTAADRIKVGSITRSSRLSKWNQLLRIEETLAGAGGRPAPFDHTGHASGSVSCSC
jgi:enolase